MVAYLHVTFGSCGVLQMVQQRYPQRPLLLVVDEGDADRYQLLELTHTKKSVFAMPTTYTILACLHASLAVRGWLNFDMITLPDLQRENFIKRLLANTTLQQATGLINMYLLQRTDNGQQLAILTTWQTRADWQKWHTATDSLLSEYETEASRYSLRRKQYHFAALSK